MGKHRRNDWAIVSHFGAFWGGWVAMLLIAEWLMTYTVYGRWHGFCAFSPLLARQNFPKLSLSFL